MAISSSVGKKGKNLKADVFTVQELLNRAVRIPYRLLDADGFIGPKTIERIEFFQHEVMGFQFPDGLIDANGKTWAVLSRYAKGTPGFISTHFYCFDTPKKPKYSVELDTETVSSTDEIAWGAKVTTAFKQKVIKIAANLGVSPDYLMACMAFETGGTFSPSIKNAAGSGATGLIQFMPSTAKHLGTTVEALAKMDAVIQLDYVEKYFKLTNKPIKTLEDVYLSILYPAAVGKDANSALFTKGKKTYEQNSGFDANKDGIITPAEISVKVRAMYNKGLTKTYKG
jgi:hypothetical protein